MMLLLGTKEVTDETFINAAVDDIAKCGFDAVCLEFRYSIYNEFDERGQKAMRAVYDRAKARGLGYVQIMPHYNKFAEKYPFLKRRCARLFEAQAKNNKIQVRHNGAGIKFNAVFALFKIEKDASGKIIAATETVPAEEKLTSVFYRAKVRENGEYAVYLSGYDGAPDYADERVELMLNDFMARYDRYELDGFAMDEFGAGSRLDRTYLCGDAFLRRFSEKYGYNFTDKIYLLDYRDEKGEFAKLRYDYFSLTEDLTFSYQKAAKEKFTARYGKDIFIGFHHTWCGEGNSADLWAGCIDYFRQDGNLSGGFVDAQYDAERTMTSLSLIAESVGRYNGGRAFSMCWDRYTTPEKTDYFRRMLAARNINWVGHALAPTTKRMRKDSKNSFVDYIYGNEELGDIPYCIKREHEFSEFIGGLQARANIAIVYYWESCAYYNTEYAHYHRLMLKAMADKLILNNFQPEIVPSFETDFSKYEVIFVPWACMIPESSWTAIKKAAAEGKRIIFSGPPATVTTEGRNIRSEFEELVGCHISLETEYMGGYEYSLFDLWVTDKKIPMIRYADDKKECIFVNKNVTYYGFELPLTDDFYNLMLSMSHLALIDGDKVISKVYGDEKLSVITLTARWQGKLNAEFRYENNEVNIKDGLICALKFENGTLIDCMADKGSITVNGKSLCYKKI